MRNTQRKTRHSCSSDDFRKERKEDDAESCGQQSEEPCPLKRTPISLYAAAQHGDHATEASKSDPQLRQRPKRLRIQRCSPSRCLTDWAFSGVAQTCTAARNAWGSAILPRSISHQRCHVRCNALLASALLGTANAGLSVVEDRPSCVERRRSFRFVEQLVRVSQARLVSNRREGIDDRSGGI